jgi:hypothetical protein
LRAYVGACLRAYAHLNSQFYLYRTPTAAFTAQHALQHF